MQSFVAALLVSVLALTLAHAACAQEAFPERWIYAGAKLGDDAGLEKFVELLMQAKESGCTHAFTVEGRWLKFPDDAAYLLRVEKAKAVARKLGITLVPGVCSVGYSGRYFHYGPDLAAGLPVKEMPFLVKGKSANADPVGDPDTTALKPEGAGVAGRLKVKPFQHYLVTFRLKGKYTGDREELIRITSRDGKRWLSRHVPPLDDKSEDQVVTTDFNSLESAEVNFRINPGAAKIEELKVALAGTLLIVRRPLVPLTVASEGDKTVYEEGKDYKPVRDPDMLKNPFDGEFTLTHKPAEIELTDGSRLKDGDKLKVSFWHTQRVGTDQDVISMEDPKALEVIELDIRNCAKVWKPAAVMLNYDEIRLAGWEPQPDGKTLKPGELLAQHFKKCYDLVRKYAPGAKIYTWSDMFTPYHNARPFSEKGYYYLVNGNWDGSWEGLPKDVVIMNWYSPKPEGMKFFADRGHQQVICGYYDGRSTAQMKNNIANWMKVSQGVPNVLGFMYTTWRSDYKQLKEYFQLLDAYAQWGQATTTKTEKEPGVAE
jgi:hypothetical protein